jgi:hypothetical protein
MPPTAAVPLDGCVPLHRLLGSQSHRQCADVIASMVTRCVFELLPSYPGTAMALWLLLNKPATNTALRFR